MGRVISNAYQLRKGPKLSKSLGTFFMDFLKTPIKNNCLQALAKKTRENTRISHCRLNSSPFHIDVNEWKVACKRAWNYNALAVVWKQFKSYVTLFSQKSHLGIYKDNLNAINKVTICQNPVLTFHRYKSDSHPKNEKSMKGLHKLIHPSIQRHGNSVELKFKLKRSWRWLRFASIST